MTILINTFCALLITCATLVVQSSNPVYSVLFLILAFFNASILVLSMGHDYMAALFIVLYVGAMCTFFLFAIMILDIKIEPISEKRLKQAPINVIIAVIFALQCRNVMTDFNSPLISGYDDSSVIMHYQPLTSNLLDTTTQIYGLGTILYTSYAFYLIIASLILLSAMLGSIALTLSRGESGKAQQIYQQNITDFKHTIVKHD